jgi:Fe-S-cluster containining protein
VKVHSLSIHADYKCRHSGACCSADWDVPVDVAVYRNLTEALDSGRLHPAAAADEGPLMTAPDRPDDAAAMLARTASGDCVFFHRGSGLCVVHRDLGELALPAPCRHFPRVAVRDERGTFITLSHFCPTAASMLFREDVPLEIVEAPPAFPPGDYDGLNVHADAWPPMLQPRMLMDPEGYGAWERHMVRRCAALDCSPESVVATLYRDARLLRRWTPASGTLEAAVASLPAVTLDAAMPPMLDDSLMLYGHVVAAVPDGLKPAADDEGLERAYHDGACPAWPQFRVPINRFLAAKAFASWAAYQGRGILTIVRGIETALALVRVEAARQCRDAGRVLDADLLREAFRATDFVLNHLAVGEDLAKQWSRVEDRQVPNTAMTGP